MFVTVRYGDGQQEVFNPNCRTINFLKCVRDRCLHCEDEIELSDESGNIKFLRDALNSYASDLLGERERLILLKVDQSENTDQRYTPMLSDQDAITEDFLARLVVKDDEVDSRPASRRGRSSKTPKNQEKENNKSVKERNKKSVHSATKTERAPRARSRQGRL